MNEPLKPRTRKPRKTEFANRERLLVEFNVITEEALASLFGVEVKTLKNRAQSDLPPFTKPGGKRLFFKDDVIAFMRKRMSD